MISLDMMLAFFSSATRPSLRALLRNAGKPALRYEGRAHVVFLAQAAMVVTMCKANRASLVPSLELRYLRFSLRS